MKDALLQSLFRNLWYKLSAIMLACLFWYIVQGEEILEINRRIVVNIKVPEGYLVKGTETRIKDATLRGSRVLLGEFSTKPLEATIHIKDGKVGQLRYRIDKEYIRNWDNRIKLTVHDPYISVFVDEKVTRAVPVKEFLKGVPADGYIIEKVSIKPNSVQVTGPKTDLAKIAEVLTEPLAVEGLSASKAFDARLVLADLPKSALSQETVQVNLSLGEKKINKRFVAVPIEVVGSEFLTAIKPRFVSIVVQGTPGVLNQVRRTDLEAFVDARDLEAGKTHNRTIQVKIPANTVLIETLPQTAALEIYNQKRLN